MAKLARKSCDLIDRMDTEILLFFNDHVGRSGFFDSLVEALGNPLVKTLPFVLLLWVFWFMRGGDVERRQNLVIGSMFTAVIAIVVGRVLAIVLPFRLRPIHDPDLVVHLPGGMSPKVLDGWSSMPSDHGVYFMALAACFFVIDRRIGALAAIYAVLIVLMPRIYFGWHWPSDILVGALVGVAVAALALPVFTRLAVALDLRGKIAAQPAFWYPFFFFVSFQMATMFETLRQALSDIARAFT